MEVADSERGRNRARAGGGTGEHFHQVGRSILVIALAEDAKIAMLAATWASVPSEGG